MTIPTMVSIKEASRQTGISYEFIRQLIRERKIIYVRAGVKFLVNMESLRHLWGLHRQQWQQVLSAGWQSIPY